MLNYEEITKFVLENEKVFIFQLSKTEKDNLGETCTKILTDKSIDENILIDAINTIRILSREKSVEVKNIVSRNEIINLLLSLSGLNIYACQSKKCMELVKGNNDVISASLKALCNIIMNFNESFPNDLAEKATKGGLMRMCLYVDNLDEITDEIKVFEVKLMFLLTAFKDHLRLYALEECEVLSTICNIFASRNNNSKNIKLKDVELDVEILKLTFNLIYPLETKSCISKEIDRDLKQVLNELAQLNVQIATLESVNARLKDAFIGNSGNLLNALPSSHYDYLILMDDSFDFEKQYQSTSAMSFFTVILKLLESRIEEGTNMNDTVTPLLHGLAKASKYNRNIRKFMRIKVLPYLKDEVRQLPEHGTTLRNRLCKLLQHPMEQVTEAAALFLFILCKESVDRAIKYTGFGNFSGFLARHSLLGGAGIVNSNNSNNSDIQEYSDSEESETEEYSAVKDDINPVTGRVEDPSQKINPLEGMSEEQKEYEVVQLMNQLDKLHRGGFIQQGVISEDGSVRPAEGILEVMERASQLSRRENEGQTESEQQNLEDEN